MSEELCGCFPGGEDLAAFAERALTGERAVPYVGDGSADTVISCDHGTWRLGDVLTYETGQADEGGDGEPPTCKEPGCKKTPAKGRKWCSTHASPKNRAGGDGGVQEGQQGDPEDHGGEGES